MIDTPRFTVHSFNYTINVNLNLEAALCLFRLVRDTPEVDPVLYAMSEKIKHQFYRMKKLDLIEKEGENNVESSRCAETSEAICGTIE